MQFKILHVRFILQRRAIKSFSEGNTFDFTKLALLVLLASIILIPLISERLSLCFSLILCFLNNWNGGCCFHLVVNSSTFILKALKFTKPPILQSPLLYLITDKIKQVFQENVSRQMQINYLDLSNNSTWYLYVLITVFNNDFYISLLTVTSRFWLIFLVSLFCQ